MSPSVFQAAFHTKKDIFTRSKFEQHLPQSRTSRNVLVKGERWVEKCWVQPCFHNWNHWSGGHLFALRLLQYGTTGWSATMANGCFESDALSALKMTAGAKSGVARMEWINSSSSSWESHGKHHDNTAPQSWDKWLSHLIFKQILFQLHIVWVDCKS